MKETTAGVLTIGGIFTVVLGYLYLHWALGGYFIDYLLNINGNDLGYFLEHLIGFFFMEFAFFGWLIALILGY